MNVHDINAKKDAAMLADLRAASTAIEPPASLDATTMAVRAVRTVRRRRLVTAVTAGAAALALLGAGLGAASTILGERQPLPGTDRTATRSAPTDGSSPGEPSPSPSSSATEPTRYLRTGDGELPVLPGVERGVVEEGGHTPYILGGLWYEVPGGGWIAVGDVNAGGVAGWLSPDHPRAGGLGEDGTIDDMDATIELRNVFDVADWTVPARDSGATTLDIEGADLVVIEQHEPEDGVRPATVRVRAGDEGWVIDTRFTADEQGESMLRDFVGNLWLEDAGAPDWFQPEFSTPVLDAIEHGVPDGWTETEHNGLRFAVPPGWTSEPTEGEFSPGVEWTGPTVTHVDENVGAPLPGDPAGVPSDLPTTEPQDVEWHERVYVQGGKPGGSWWTRSMSEPQSQMIDVPGADYAEVLPTVHNTAGEPDYYWVDIYLHQEDRGENLFLVVEFDGTEQGLRDLHAFLGSLDFRR